MTTAVLGAGAWGTALALVLSGKGRPVRLWTWQREHAEALVRERENRQFFPGFELPSELRVSADLERTLDGAEWVVLVVPSEAFRETLTQARPHLDPGASLVSASKGIETKSCMLLSQVAEQVLGEQAQRRFAALSGPSFAVEVAAGAPTSVALAATQPELALDAQEHFATERFRVYTSSDPTGVQVGGALKNVIAIAVGACGGLGFGHNARAGLITRGLAELSRLASALGGSERTLSGLAGLGDLVLTCTGDLSRNRTVGFELGRGRKLQEVLEQLGHVAEGVTTAESAYHLAERLGVDLPICTEVYRVLHEGKPPREAVRDLLARPLRSE
jgi:glycerol-3-phosphate dehydrogenase (NAD(P)+)